MKTENNIPPAFATSTHANLEGGVQVDVYLRHEKPVAIVLWRGNEPQPYAAYKDSDDGRLVRFTVTANDDVPKHDRRESHLNVQAEVFTSPNNESVRGLALYREQQAEPFLTVTGAGTSMRLYPFNDRSNGIFANDFRDRDGRPVADTFGATMRAVLHGREARDWPLVQTAKLVAEYSSDQMDRLMEVVNVRSRDDEWRGSYQDKGLAGSEELASILSSRWPQTYRPAGDKEHPLPLVAVEVEPNTFSFYVSEKGDKKMVRVHQFTDFRGTILEDDFPMGSSNEWSAGMPKTFTDMEAVSAVGRSLLKDWECLPKTFPSAEAPPYDPNDMDAAVAYTQRTKALFAAGDHDAAYAHYLRDPNGGAQSEFSKTTKEHFVVGMYNTRDVQGKPLYPQPKGYQYAGFTVGHEAHLRDDNSWAKIGHLFEFEGKPYVMLEFDQPVSTFTDGDGRLQVLRGVAAAESPAARDTRLLVAADLIDDTRVPARDQLFREDGLLKYLSYSQASGKRNAALMLSCRTAGLPTLTTSLIVDGRDFKDVYSKAVTQLAEAFGVAGDVPLVRDMHATVDAFMEKNILAKADLREPPQDNDAFDAYMANEHFHKIERVEVMEDFLLRAARRFHVLDVEQSAAINADETLPAVKQKAWEFLYDQFSNSMSDLRMFFSETDDYYEQSPEERKRLNAVADALVCSAKDVTKIEQAERLGAAAVVVDSTGEANGLSDDQRAAVVAFRDANGRDWKEELGALWMNGNYSRRGIDMDQAALLQQVRNELGPEWLVNVKRADLDAPKRVDHDDADLSM